MFLLSTIISFHFHGHKPILLLTKLDALFTVQWCSERKMCLNFSIVTKGFEFSKTCYSVHLSSTVYWRFNKHLKVIVFRKHLVWLKINAFVFQHLILSTQQLNFTQRFTRKFQNFLFVPLKSEFQIEYRVVSIYLDMSHWEIESTCSMKTLGLVLVDYW